MSTPQNETYRFGTFELDATARVLLRDGAVVSLAPKAIDTLVVLVRERGRIVDRERLMRAVWPDAFVEEAGLTRNISVLRKALEADCSAAVIETIPKRGYRFLLPVEPVVTPSSPEVDPALAPPPLPFSEPRPARGNNLIVWAALAGVGLVVAATLSLRNPGNSAAALRPAAVAVLPFTTSDGTGDLRVLGDGMADALVSRLAADYGIEVRSSRATVNYHDAGRRPAEVGRELSVDAVVIGTVAREAQRLRASARLVSVADGRTLWSGEFDEAAEELFALHDGIAQAVAREVGRPRSATTARSRRPKTPVAYEAYLTGRHHWNRRTRDELEAAVKHFGLALNADPTYASAYAGLADAYALLGVYGAIAPADAFARARVAATRAIDLDETLAEPHASLGFVRFAFEWNWDDADAAFRRAIALDPNYATAHHWHAILLMVRGRAEDSLRAIRRAEQLDPLSPSIATDLGSLLHMAHRFDEAIVFGMERRRLHPNDPRVATGLAQSLARSNRPREALAAIAGIANPTDGTVAAHVESLALLGEQRQAELVLAAAEAKAAAEGRQIDPFQHALSLIALKQTEQAFVLLEQAFQARLISLTWLKVAPQFGPLVGDPRYQDLLRRMRLND